MFAASGSFPFSVAYNGLSLWWHRITGCASTQATAKDTYHIARQRQIYNKRAIKHCGRLFNSLVRVRSADAIWIYAENDDDDDITSTARRLSPFTWRVWWFIQQNRHRRYTRFASFSQIYLWNIEPYVSKLNKTFKILVVTQMNTSYSGRIPRAWNFLFVPPNL